MESGPALSLMLNQHNPACKNPFSLPPLPWRRQFCVPEGLELKRELQLFAASGYNRTLRPQAAALVVHTGQRRVSLYWSVPLKNSDHQRTSCQSLVSASCCGN